MKKRMEINIVDMDRGKTYTNERWNSSSEEYVDEAYHAVPINKNDYPNLVLDHEIDSEEFNNAMKVITTYAIQNKASRLFIDLHYKNIELAPAKEMTIKEIEKVLGHKVKIVNKKEE